MLLKYSNMWYKRRVCLTYEVFINKKGIGCMKKNIVKRVVTAAMAMLMVGSLAACNTKIAVEFEYDASQYIKLGQYKDLEVSIDTDAIAEEIVTKKIETDMKKYTEYTETKREAAEGDRVTLEFSGTIGGKKVDAFGSSDYQMVLGTDTFIIDGFVDALYGMKAGDMKIVTLTVPENFSEDEQYAGSKIVYEIKMSKVEQIVVPMITDAFVKDMYNCDTVEIYRETLKKNLASDIDSSVQTKKKELALTKLQDNVEVTGYPEAFLEKKKEELQKSINYYAIMQNMSADTYCQKNFDMTFDEYVKKSVVQDAIIQLIIKEEELVVTEYEYKGNLQSFALSQGYTDKDAFVEKFGKNDIVKNMLYEKAQNLVVDSAVIK